MIMGHSIDKDVRIVDIQFDKGSTEDKIKVMKEVEEINNKIDSKTYPNKSNREGFKNGSDDSKRAD